MEYIHWKKLTNPDYLGAYSFTPGEIKTATIKSISQELVCGADGKKEHCIVAKFVEDLKPLVLCKTNCKAIAKVCGTPNINAWKGVLVSLHVEKVKAFGEIVDAVRISPKPPVVDFAEAPSCAQCGNAITGVGKTSAAQIAKYTQGKYGKPLCPACAESAAAALKESHPDALEEAGNTQNANTGVNNNQNSPEVNDNERKENENENDSNQN